MSEPLTPIEIEEGWVAQPCGCAYHPGTRVARPVGGGMIVAAEGFRRRWCQAHTDELESERLALRARLYEVADQPALSPMERWLQRNR